MHLSRVLRPAWGVVALGLALSLLAAPMPVRADEDDDDDKKDQKEVIRIYRHDGSETAIQRGAFLGVQVQDVTRALRRARDLPTSEGAIVNRVEEDSPAASGGLRRGDVIVELDGRKVEDSEDLIEAVRDQEPGSRIRVTLWRSGSLKTVSVTLAERPKEHMMRSPDFPRVRSGGDDSRMIPMPPPPGVSGMRSGDMNGQLRSLEAQLQRLRDVEIPKLEEEIRALRSEIRRSHDNHDEDDDRDRGRDRDDDEDDD